MAAQLERTLAIIKPDAIEYLESIRRAIEDSGFSIQKEKHVQLTSEQVSDLFADQIGKHTWPIFVSHMQSGTIVAIELACVSAVDRWLTICGPENPVDARTNSPDSLRAVYGQDLVKNAVHGSATIQQAQREIQFFFPESIVEPLTTPEEADDYLAKHVNPTLEKGLIALCENKPIDPEQWLADWLIANNPNTPNISA